MSPASMAPGSRRAPGRRRLDVGVVLVAAGTGERLGAGGPKALVEVAGRPLLVHAIDQLDAAGVAPPVVVHTPGAHDAFAAALVGRAVRALVAGGATRTHSVRAGVAALDADVEVVAVHDAARALMPAEVMRRCLDVLAGDVIAVAPALPVADTLKRVAEPAQAASIAAASDGAAVQVHGTVERAGLVGVQTPQVFPRWVLEAVLDEADAATDDLALVERAVAAGRLTGRVVVVPGSVLGAKITYPDDLVVAAALLRAGAAPGADHAPLEGEAAAPSDDRLAAGP